MLDNEGSVRVKCLKGDTELSVYLLSGQMELIRRYNVEAVQAKTHAGAVQLSSKTRAGNEPADLNPKVFEALEDFIVCLSPIRQSTLSTI